MNDRAEVLDDLVVSVDVESKVGVVEIRRPPNNFLDLTLLDRLVAALRQLDADASCKCVLVKAAGKHFCAGRDFTKPRQPGDESSVIYEHAAALLETRKPWIAVVQGAAVGAGLGLAATADFRIASSRAYFWPNFVTVGLHHGFGLSATLPHIVGQHRAAAMLMTGSKVNAEQAYGWGLVDRVVPEADLSAEAIAFARAITASPSEAVESIRATMRAGLAVQFRRATSRESSEQARLTSSKASA